VRKEAAAAIGMARPIGVHEGEPVVGTGPACDDTPRETRFATYRRCLSAPTRRLNAALTAASNVVGAADSLDGFTIRAANASAAIAAACSEPQTHSSPDPGTSTSVFMTSGDVLGRPPRSEPALTVPRIPMPPSSRLTGMNGGSATARSNVAVTSARSGKARGSEPRSNHRPTTARESSTQRSTVNLTARPRDPSQQPAATRVEARLQQYRDSEEERRALEARLAQYRQEERRAKRLGVPVRDVRRPAPTEAPPVVETSRVTMTASGVPLEVDPDAIEKLDSERCHRWFQQHLAAQPVVQLRPTPDEIKEHNDARERYHKERAIVAAAEVRWRKEQATSDARRAAARCREAAEQDRQDVVQRSMQWSTAVVLATQMQRVFMRNHAMASLMARATHAVRLMDRVFRAWMAPAVLARKTARRRRIRAFWYEGIAAARLIARLHRKRRQVDRISAYLNAMRSLGRIAIAVRQYHRKIVICQRAVRHYLQFRLWRLQLLHLQWDHAESALVAKRQQELSDCLDGRLAAASPRKRSTAAAGGGANDRGRAAVAANKKADRKARTAQISTNLSEEEKVRLIVDNDIRSGVLNRATPFLFRHRAIVKFWAQTRRGFVRRALERDRDAAVEGSGGRRDSVTVRRAHRTAAELIAATVASVTFQRPGSSLDDDVEGHHPHRPLSPPQPPQPHPVQASILAEAHGVTESVASRRPGSAKPSALHDPLEMTIVSHQSDSERAASPAASSPLPPKGGASSSGRPRSGGLQKSHHHHQQQKPPRGPAMPVLMPKERLDRVMLHALEEYAGLCREQCLIAARSVVIAKMAADTYSYQRDALISTLFNESKLEEEGFKQMALVRNGALILSLYGAGVAPRKTAMGAAVKLARAAPSSPVDLRLTMMGFGSSTGNSAAAAARSNPASPTRR
jgi:hypothetical protein